MDGKHIAASRALHLIPLDNINGYDVRPGFYEINGATALREGVNFTVCSLEASSVELLLYHRGDKEPYVKDLGITAVELMPVFEFDETIGKREVNGRMLLDYWGYNPVSFFAPNTSYTANKEFNREGDELKALIRDLNSNGIEVILDVVFNYTAEGNEQGAFFSFKGFDNRNCGAEGETSNPEIQKLRFQMMKNACMSLMCSRGTPMFLSGDEFGDTRFGNNNPYCQDNETSWLNWNRLAENRKLYSFFKKMIWFRREHPAIRSNQEPSTTGFPAVSVHTNRPWDSTIGSATKALAICYAGKTSQGENLVYMALNVYWEGQKFELPKLPDGYEWRCFADTALDGTGKEDNSSAITEYWVHPRSAAVFTGVKR